MLTLFTLFPQTSPLIRLHFPTHAYVIPCQQELCPHLLSSPNTNHTVSLGVYSTRVTAQVEFQTSQLIQHPIEFNGTVHISSMHHAPYASVCTCSPLFSGIFFGTYPGFSAVLTLIVFWGECSEVQMQSVARRRGDRQCASRRIECCDGRGASLFLSAKCILPKGQNMQHHDHVKKRISWPCIFPT